ncbi:lysophosphatidic acid phosphatase type 6-like [Physella acuta]|uniref:lysophosphatidic acid phosphatase type 6-like n=1 Tax=Physella acuta TaxID=109671 RepID=UPI0027DE445D|nr:lysophosphatidic acid phosphatase type 6-like [Physella acuta]
MICCGGSKAQKQKRLEEESKDSTTRGQELYKPLLNDNLVLVQIQMVFRHGARTPLNFVKGLEEATYDISLEEDIEEADYDMEVVKLNDGSPAGKSSMEPDLRARKLKGGAHASILTAVGQRQMYNLGVVIRNSYLPALNLYHYNTRDVYIRSSHVERTVKSIKCLLAGIFGKDDLNKAGPIKLPVKHMFEEDIFPNKLACPALRLIIDLTLSNIDSLPGMKQDRQTVTKVMGRFQPPPPTPTPGHEARPTDRDQGHG